MMAGEDRQKRTNLVLERGMGWLGIEEEEEEEMEESAAPKPIPG